MLQVSLQRRSVCANLLAVPGDTLAARTEDSEGRRELFVERSLSRQDMASTESRRAEMGRGLESASFFDAGPRSRPMLQASSAVLELARRAEEADVTCHAAMLCHHFLRCSAWVSGP